jgi:hypothetical protein
MKQEREMRYYELVDPTTEPKNRKIQCGSDSKATSRFYLGHTPSTGSKLANAIIAAVLDDEPTDKSGRAKGRSS